MEKMTNAKALNYVLSNCELPTDVREKLEKMAEQTAKKHSSEHKPTVAQVQNEGFKLAIYEGLHDNAMTISEMIKAIPEISELSNQRVSAIVRQMVEDKMLAREEIKRKAYFSRA